LEERSGHEAVWTGLEMAIVGGTNNGLPDVAAAAYSPRRDRWRILPAPIGSPLGHEAVWTGREIVLWGGRTRGQRFDPAGRRWLVLRRPPVHGRIEHTAVWTGRAALFWGGEAGNDCCYQLDGVAYVPSRTR
jgi:hypothetical protein